MSGFPEEWPKVDGGAACRELDSAVRCPICGEPFEAPLSLACGHACECSLRHFPHSVVNVSIRLAYDGFASSR